MTDDPGTDPEGDRIKSLDDRFGALEKEQAEQKGLLSQILGKLGGTPAKTDTPAPAAAVGSVADQVRDELARQGREKADADEKESIKAQLAKLAEKPPREPERKITRILWGDPS
jgi:hypothetical protein